MGIIERNSELSSIIDALSRHLEFLDYAGVRDLPASAWSPPADELASVEALPAAKPFVEEQAPAGEHGPVAFTIWRLGGVVAFVEGARVSGGVAKPFSPEHIAQLEKLAVWMSGKLGIKKSFSAKHGWTGEYPTPEAGALAVAAWLRKNPPRMVVISGPVAAGALLGCPDVKTLRGRFHDLGGISAVATHSLGAILEDQLLKNEANNDLLMALERLK